MLTEKCAPPICQFFVWLQPPKNIYLFVDIYFLFHLGRSLSNEGEELLYYHFYNK